MNEDPNESYDVIPFKPTEGGIQLTGWYTCQQNGIDQWHGPKESMDKLATDPEARKEARRSKKLHDRKPS